MAAWVTVAGEKCISHTSDWVGGPVAAASGEGRAPAAARAPCAGPVAIPEPLACGGASAACFTGAVTSRIGSITAESSPVCGCSARHGSRCNTAMEAARYRGSCGMACCAGLPVEHAD